MTNEQLIEALGKAYELLTYAAPDEELVKAQEWTDDCDRWLDTYAPSKIKGAAEPSAKYDGSFSGDSCDGRQGLCHIWHWDSKISLYRCDYCKRVRVPQPDAICAPDYVRPAQNRSVTPEEKP